MTEQDKLVERVKEIIFKQFGRLAGRGVAIDIEKAIRDQ